MVRDLPTRRALRRSNAPIWAAVAIAVIVHGAIFGTVYALGLSIAGYTGANRASAAKSEATADDVELAASCGGNAWLETSGRAALCFAPWVGDVDACVRDAQLGLWMALSACQARNDPRTAIAMVETKTTDAVKPIDPEKLLEELRAPPKPTTPPPPPPPQVAMAQPPPPPPPPPPQQRPQQPQVIETVKPSQEQEPENARFLSEFNTRAEKEKVSRGARNEPMVAKAKPESLTPTAQPKDEPSVTQKQPDREIGRNEHAPDVAGKLSMRNPGALASAAMEQEAKIRGSATGASGELAADGMAMRRGDGAIAQDKQARSEIPRGQGGAGGGAPEAPTLKPTQEMLERALGGGSVDHLENVEDADETSLSSKRWVYASFFNRLKRQVAQHWDPGSVWRHADPTGTVYGQKTRFTEVRVSLSKTGDVQQVLVTTASGVTALDDEAVRAFRVAGPFPNPPDGLVQKDNQITFAFGFYFGIGQPRVSWRLPTAM